MLTQTVQKPASSRQRAYINRLRTQLEEQTPETQEEMSSFEASKLIGELLNKARTNGSVVSQSLNGGINEARLGMAMKECFRLQTRYGIDVWDTKRKNFIRRAIETNYLFSEIVEMVKHGHQIKEKGASGVFLNGPVNDELD